MKKVFISQPRYSPNLSYLKKILDSDVFIILDDVQINKREYQHRNMMMRKGQALKWLTIPLTTGKQKLIELCREVGGTDLIVGTGAANYGLTPNYGNLHNIHVDVRDYTVNGYEGSADEHLPFAHFELIGENVKDLLDNHMINKYDRVTR